jgi:hypothetical protein
VYKRQQREFIRQETGREGSTKEKRARRSRENVSKELKKGEDRKGGTILVGRKNNSRKEKERERNEKKKKVLATVLIFGASL